MCADACVCVRCVAPGFCTWDSEENTVLIAGSECSIAHIYHQHCTDVANISVTLFGDLVNATCETVVNDFGWDCDEDMAEHMNSVTQIWLDSSPRAPLNRTSSFLVGPLYTSLRGPNPLRVQRVKY